MRDKYGVTDNEWEKLNAERIALITKGTELTQDEKVRLADLQKQADRYVESLPGFDEVLVNRLRRMFQHQKHHKKARRR